LSAVTERPVKAPGGFQYKSAAKKIRRHWQLYFIIMLPFLHMIIFRYIPMYGVLIAFKEFRISMGILKSPWVGLKWFVSFFNTPSAFQIISNTLMLSIYGLLAGTLFAILLAISLNEMRTLWYKKLVQMVSYAPYFISTVVLVSLLLQFFNTRLGLVNIIINALGGESVNFLNDSKTFRPMYVWSGIWQGTGYSAIIYIAALSSINPELYESARIDGANRLQKIWHIDLPGITPTIIMLMILSLGGILNVGFEKTFLMQNAMNLRYSEVISTYVYKVGLQQHNFSFSTAVGMFNSLVSLVLIVGVNFLARRYTETSLW